MITLHLISHTHWDREWHRPFQEFRLELVRLIDGLLELLARDREYKFFMLDGQTIVLEDYLAVRPEREAELRRFIRGGRILVGPWHVLPDEFLAGPESTVRNLLEGARTCRRFGPRMPVGYAPDPFGHIGQLPQILRGFGIEYAAFRRGLADEPCEVWWEAPDGSRVLAAYLRDGYDNAAGLPTGDPALFAEEAARRLDSLRPHAATDELILMHGTDHMRPPPGTSAAVRSAKGRIPGARLIHSTLPDYFAAAASAVRRRKLRLPVVRGELRSPKRHHLLPGVLSTRMWIKQQNRECEVLLEKWAEPFSAWASLLPRSVSADPLLRAPQGALREAWRMLMQNHPHDSICGCSVDAVHEEMRPRFAQAAQIAGEIARAARTAVAEAVDTRAAGTSVVAFNPAAGPRTGPVEVEAHPPAEWDAFEVVDPDGTVIPHQAAGGGSAERINIVLDRESFIGVLGGLHEGQAGNLSVRTIRFHREAETLRVDAEMAENGSPDLEVWKRAMADLRECLRDPAIQKFHIRARNIAGLKVLFVAPEVPGFGWKTFSLRKKSAPPPAQIALHPLLRPIMPLAVRFSRSGLGKRLIERAARAAPAPVIENEFFRIRADADGTLDVLDKRTGVRYRGLNRFLDGGDCGDSYNYCPPAKDAVAAARRKSVRARKESARQVLDVDLEIDVPLELTADRRRRSAERVILPITTRVAVYPGVARVDIHTVVENRAHDHRLRVHFPFGGGPEEKAVARCDGHFEIVERAPAPPADDSQWVERRRPEIPQRAFTDLSTERRGLMIANRGLPEVEAAAGRGIALTLLRCVGWLSRDDFPARKGHAGPMLPLPGAQMEGRWEFDYAVIPHGGDWRAASALARAFEAPMRAAETGAHGGGLPATGSIVDVRPPEFEISAIKLSEDGRGLLIRGWNSTERPLRIRIRPGRMYKQAERVNLAEDRLTVLRMAGKGEVRFTAKPHEIASVIFREK